MYVEEEAEAAREYEMRNDLGAPVQLFKKGDSCLCKIITLLAFLVLPFAACLFAHWLSEQLIIWFP